MKTKDPIHADVTISGAGPAGLALATLLGRAGLRVALIDATKPSSAKPAPDKLSGRTAALLRGSINVLKQTGIWEDLKDECIALRSMRIIDDSLPASPQVRVEFHAVDIGYDEFGYNIPNAALVAALQKRMAAIKSIQHLAGVKLSSYSVQKNHALITLDDGRTIKTPLLIGTDGRNSPVREIAGIETKIHDYGQTAMTFLIEHSKPHNNTSTEFHRSGGPFTFVPMKGNVSSVVWVEKTEDAKAFLSMKKQDFARALQDRSTGLLGEITVKSNPESWPLMFLSANDLVAERVALAAEAAHVISPIGAQGLNLSLRDVAALAETIVDAARLGEDIGSGSVLSRYNRRRRLDIKTRTTGIDGLNRVVANDLFFLKDMRRLGLKGLDTIPALKQLVTHQGLAPSMDEGRLLLGQSL